TPHKFDFLPRVPGNSNAHAGNFAVHQYKKGQIKSECLDRQNGEQAPRIPNRSKSIRLYGRNRYLWLAGCYPLEYPTSRPRWVWGEFWAARTRGHRANKYKRYSQFLLTLRVWDVSRQ